MVQGYYTLEEASRILGMEAEELSQMAQRRQVRAFADRGTWRFRTQDIEELARQRGAASNPDLQLGEGAKGPGSRATKADDPGVFTFALGDAVHPGAEDQVSLDPPAKKGPKSSGRNLGGRTPAPKPGSDSDVR